MSDPLHLAVALDGTGWHPAAWREPAARPAELFTPGYWIDLIQEARRDGAAILAILHDATAREALSTRIFELAPRLAEVA